MKNEFRSSVVRGAAREKAAVDQGLRAFMISVYNYMTLGIALTGVVAFFVSTSPELLQLIFGTPLRWVVMLAPLGFVFYFSARIHTMSATAAQVTFWLFAALMGVSLASIFIVYNLGSIAKVFFITAGTFGAMSLYGYTTNRDLTNWGSFLFMGLIGIIIASLVNIFLASSALEFGISLIGVLIFTGLTAYDSQNIKNMYLYGDEEGIAVKKAVMGALTLYLDFINLFIMLLRLLGNRR
ncbi:Bax inhibitor-1/YccA family protein [Candidatus Nucleicultrix amoebiphila]|jgi:FtsH-binding integral membrane protein|uniref:Membrane protein n=1 Tax=Candidatus Nucleicultrix amoebiphila FS5 TaxID=1414854 RepID=A0A1W6N4Z1_9PROT|nr:Bax inhibitor-1/YccA family protein [Candidatus Nucleicultrix amoebiphila]ARN84828.1 membrane protein [Candidatus Nucleicultrix amoebiphila FS5]